ncbi:hypothetical protein ABGB12_01910 [Actinocorallia sp. B10E7]|uniref:hypothetical protein n=1 Tax=Actinocorallia sp. B10E7 TaxID=3153558 RepID=UPI00325EB301
MSAKRISRRTAEQMLCGSSAGHPVTELLNSAAAPGRAEELSGEMEAVAAFQAARVDAPVLSALSEEHREKPSLRSLLAKTLTAPVIGVVLAIGAVGGVAIAANGGVPGHKEEKPRKPPSVTSTPTLTRKYAAPPAPAPAATPSTADLCRAYITQGGQDKHLAPLVKAAGGRKKVIAFCIALLGWDKNKPNGQWPPQGWPTDWPTSWPLDRGWPTEWPGELPKEWVRPPDLKQDKQQRKARGEGSAERQSLWPEGWPELELWPRQDQKNN